MEEFLLHALLAGEELNVVDDQRIELTESAAECIDAAAEDRADQLVGERLGRYQRDAARAAAAERVRDGGSEMRLAETHAPEEEERIVCRTRVFGDLTGGRMSERVALADDEAVERVGARP